MDFSKSFLQAKQVPSNSLNQWWSKFWISYAGIILCMHPANGRPHYTVNLIGWCQAIIWTNDLSSLGIRWNFINLTICSKINFSKILVMIQASLVMIQASSCCLSEVRSPADGDGRNDGIINGKQSLLVQDIDTRCSSLIIKRESRQWKQKWCIYMMAGNMWISWY